MVQISYKVGHVDLPDEGFKQGPNSAGGNTVLFSVKNVSDKTIKYYHLYFKPKNAVGDDVTDSISGLCEKSVKGTGPLAPNAFKKGLMMENAWYNHSVTRVVLTKVKLEYMDGSKEEIDGIKIESFPGAFSSGGCYIATCVYGSYDCPEVWTLRRYRDYSLVETWCGRAFIHTYYAISPTIVKLFGSSNWFKNCWRGKLDKIVNKLRKQGVEDTPYDDINW